MDPDKVPLPNTPPGTLCSISAHSEPGAARPATNLGGACVETARGTRGSCACPCLLYTSDAADDM
eukprot:8890932-Lingulodinium_polyedra.AAC.1